MEWITKLLAQIGGQLAAIGAAIAAAVSALLYHRVRVRRAETQGQRDGATIERRRIEEDTRKATEYLEQRANEITEEIERDTATDDDLRERMRDAARPSDKP